MDYHESPSSSRSHGSRRSDRARRKMNEINQRDQLLRLRNDEEQTAGGHRGVAAASSLLFDTRDGRSQGSQSNLRSHRGIDDGLSARLHLNRAPRSQSSLSQSISTEHSGAVLLNMSMDQEQYGEPADFMLSGPVVSVGRGRMGPTASVGAGASRSTSASLARAPLSPSTGVGKRRPSRGSGDGGPAPGAYNVRGRAIGSLPAWVRNPSQMFFNRRPSGREIRSNSEPHLQDSMSDIPPVSPGNDTSIPPELRVIAPEQPPPEMSDADFPPELGGSTLSNQAGSEESVPGVPTGLRESRKGGVNKMWCAILAALILSGIGVGVSMTLRANAQRNNSAVADAGNSLPLSSPAPVMPVPSPSPSPRPCSEDYDVLSGAHRTCLCTGSFNDWGDDSQEVAATVEKVLKVDPGLNNILTLLEYNDTQGYTCDPIVVALFWLAEDVNMNNTPKESWGQRFLLASLFLSWTQDDPFRWRIWTNWLSEKSECTWSGIRCDEFGQVEVIRLSRNNLATSAGFPEEICLLTSLTSLDISFNSLHIESIPSCIANLTMLKTLNLRSSTLGGSMRYETFPTTLVELLLEGARVNSEISATIKNLVNLEILEMQVAEVTGTLPSELGALTRLRELRLGGNANLLGGIPSEIGMLSALSTIDLQYNVGMAVILVTEIGLLTSLVELNFNSGSCTGSIPSEIGLLANLTMLGLKGEVDVLHDLFSSYSGLSGPIPSEIGKLSQLVSINLGENSLSGQIPTEIGQLLLLKECDLGLNLLDGTIPTEIAALTNLELLRLRGDAERGYERNRIEGTFPSALGNLVNLECFDAGGTLLTGTFPESFCASTSTSLFINLRCVGVSGVCSCCECDADDKCAALV